MPKLKTQAAKQNLLRRVRRQRLKYITILPSLVTILNGLCGFAAIILIAHSEFTKAGYILLLAMVADVIDGHLARMNRNATSFGGQLDSLCDIISFGVAPAFLMFWIVESRPDGTRLEVMEKLIWLAAAAYTSCAAIRLARFNVENDEDKSSHLSFFGLPSPVAAGVIVSTVIFHQETLDKVFPDSSKTYAFFDNAIIYALPVVSLLLAVLMVSRIRYSHVLNQYVGGKKPFAHLIWLLIGLGLVVWNLPAALLLIFWSFAASGLVKWVYYKIARKADLLTAGSEQMEKIAIDASNCPTRNDNA